MGRSRSSLSRPLSLRALNRATLARQHLLSRAKAKPVAVIERLAGLQAQVAWPPFVGLWSRLERFERESLLAALRQREVVRATAMRGMLHLLSVRDYARLRPSLQPGLTKGMLGILRDRAAGIDVPTVVKLGKKLFAKPAAFDAVRGKLAAEFPALDERAMGFVVRMQVPLWQVPDDSRWGFPKAADFVFSTVALHADDSPHELVRRYLAAFGPATPQDMQTWSGLPGLKPVFESMRDGLVSFRDDRGRELFDLPDSPRPTEDADAPVRLLPDFDNLVLGHDDRRRIVADEHKKALVTKNLQVAATFLVDGFVAGTWKIDRSKKKTAKLALAPFGSVPARAKKALLAEAEALLQFTEPEGTQLSVAI
ncbi:MAG: AlkZ family DNA glycosylase [Archangiaceae bacterium]|nr:AlkZ family DNA glycosylase [Archangiaceae bacterium]